MPYTPTNTKCGHLGCNNPKSKLNSYCTDHGGREYTVKQSDSVYHSPAWKSLRMRQLSIQPLCQGCLAQGKITAAKHVDHVFPWRRIGPSAFLNNIFQSLCPEHHSYKTGQEKHGVYMYWTQEGEEKLSEHDYATRIMPNARDFLKET